MSSQRASQGSSRKRKADDSFSQPSTSRDHVSSRKRRIIVEDDDDDDGPSTSRGYRPSKQARLTNGFNNLSETQNREHENLLAGKIEKIQMINFMCHSNLEIPFNDRINFITGRNGSGKSAVMAALTVVLGGSAKDTGRGAGISEFIKKGENSGKVSITLVNEGLNSYKKDVYGNRITITRQFTKTTNTYTVKSAFGYIISKKKEEVGRITTQFNIQIHNPICILNQDVARTFLGATEPNLRFELFMKATQLQELKEKYGQTYELLYMSQSALKDKEKTLEEASKEVKALKHKMELFMALERDKKQMELIENEYIWSLACMEERKLAALIEKRQQVEQRKKDMENHEAGYDDIIKTLQNKIKEHEQTINDFTDTKNEKRNTKGEYHKEAQKIQKEIDSADVELRGLRNKISRHVGNINGIKEHMAQSEDNASQSQVEKENSAEKMKQKKAELNEIKDRMSTVQRDVNNAETTLEQHQQDLERQKTELRDIERRKENLEVRLNHANLSQSTQKSANLAKFGPVMPRLVEQINEAYKRGQFDVKPIGPCGAYITLKSDKKQWARAVESVIGGLMPTFCCDNQKDFNGLTKIIERVCAGQRQPNVIISKFRSHKHNISSRKVTQFPPIIDQIDVANDIVYNTLIDQAGVEAIALFESDAQASQFLSHVQNVPKNLSMGVTIKSSQYYPAPNYRSYSTKDGPLQFFDEPVKSRDAIKSIENELHQAERELAEKRSQINDLKMKIQSSSDFLKQKQSLLIELRKRNRIVEAELNELKDVEDSRPTIQTRVALEEELQREERQHQISTDKLKQATEKLNNLKTEAERWAEKLRKASEEEKEINAQLSSVQERLEEVKFELSKEKRQKQTAGTKLEEAKNELEKTEKDIKEKEKSLEQKIKDATESCPERVETNRSPVEIERELQKCKRKIQQAEKVTGNKEESIEEYKTKREAFRRIKSSIKKMEHSIENLAKKTGDNEDRFNTMLHYTAGAVSLRFQAGLQTRHYDGSLKFDFDKKTLDFEVQPRDEAVARKDAKTLSGGERSYATVSFILAIWKSIHMPFYFLDEFDVFMDKLNRKIILDLLLDHCKTTSIMQFVFITPQDISSIQASDILKIFKMPDPERRRV